MARVRLLEVRWKRFGLRPFGLAAIALLVVLVSLPAAASGTNWFGATGVYGQCTGGNRADAEPESFYYEDLEPLIETATDWVRANVFPPSGLSTQYDSSPDDATDIIMRDRYYEDYCGVAWATSPSSGGVYGLTTCNGLDAPSTRCESQDVRINNRAVVTTSLARENVCHETGHAVGLKHPATEAEMLGFSCLNAGAGRTNWSPHDLTHVTYIYG